MQVPLNSGDQALWWDAPLKLRVLADRGIPVIHEVHSVDQFSRSVVRPNQPVVLREYALPGGQRSLWSSAMKTVPFLGRILITPEEVSRYVTGKFDEQFFVSDTFGAAIPQGDRVIEGIPFAEVRGCFNRLRGLMRENLAQTLVDSLINEERWSELFNLISTKTEAETLTLAALWQMTLKRWLGLDHDSESTPLRITTSFDNFTDLFGQRGSELFRFFVREYEGVAPLYNAVSRKHGMAELDIERGELPYFTIRDDWGRETLYVGRLSDGRVPMPKAIPLLIDLLGRTPTVMPEHGSVYSSASAEFLNRLRGRGYSLQCHQVWRVSFNALDNLAGLNFRFRLPPYLRPHFGTEVIAADDFARSWRNVVEGAQKELEGVHLDLHGEELAHFLVARGRLEEETAERFFLLRRKMAVSRGKDRDDDILSGEVTYLRSKILERKLALVVELLQVAKSLPYWNCRPYYWWVALVNPSGEWKKAIIRNARIYQEQLGEGS